MAEVHLLEFTTEEIQEKFPLHWCVWNDNTQKLEELLASKLVSFLSKKKLIQGFTCL